MLVEPRLNVLVTSPERVLYEGTARGVIVPGAEGTFEILPLHRSLVSRLLGGVMVIDDRSFPIRRGAIRVADDTVVAVVELST
jgi:F-type H+-transporting ATPase subunit epsilon